MEPLFPFTSLEALFHAASFVAAPAVTTLFSAVWEGTLLAACLVLCLRLFPGLSAAARSVIWMNVLLLLVMLQLFPYLREHQSPGDLAQSAPLQIDLAWCYVIAGIWMLLSLFRGTQLVLSAIRLRTLARRATPLQPGPVLRPLLQIRTLGINAGRSAELCVSSEVERPSVFGFFHPRILLPPALLERLTTLELRQVVIHEMEHLRRADDWTNLLQKIALVLFPLNPALLWVERRLCAERELACDDRVLRSSCGRKAYAICLTRLAEHSMLRRSVSLALGAWERQSELLRRVHRVLSSPNKLMSGKQTMLLTSSLILAVLLSALTLARSPQLVTFATPPDSFPGSIAQAHPLPPLEQLKTNREHFAAAPELVKAIMPERRIQSLSAATHARRNATLLRAKPQRIFMQPQAWLVMTEWNETGVSQRLILTVRQGNPSSYAAVPIANGWLIVQI